MDQDTIRSSVAEFLIFEQQAQTQEDSIEVRYEDENLWITQKMMAALFDVRVSAIKEHLKSIFESGELERTAAIRNFQVMGTDESRQSNCDMAYYSLDAIIAVGLRVNSDRAIQFRRWAMQVLERFTVTGYALDSERLENGSIFGDDYFEHLLDEIQEIRLSKRRFYQKITDLYATAIDYDKSSPVTKSFYVMVRDKFYSDIARTAAKSMVKSEPAKDEPDDLGHIVNALLDLAESAARCHVPMTMEDWAGRMGRFLLEDNRDILKDVDTICMEITKIQAGTGSKNKQHLSSLAKEFF